MKTISERDFEKIFSAQSIWLDVRAPVEFITGAMPGAVNLPLLNNEERHEIGTLYKNEGSEAAVRRGHILVSGEIKAERVRAWKNHFEKNPASLLYCFRGGLRSQTVQKWLLEEGVDIPRVEGGYKALRRFLTASLEKSLEKIKFIVVSGPTGSGKSRYLHEQGRSHIDLESLAHHRGSAFGAFEAPQPAQSDFENRLAVELLRLQNCDEPVYIEDESRLIGKICLPDLLYAKMKRSPIIQVAIPFAQRVDHIFNEYVVDSSLGRDGDRRRFREFENAVHAISRKLGGVRAAEILADLVHAENEFIAGRGLGANRIWIEKILVWYYDPLYAKSLKRHHPISSE